MIRVVFNLNAKGLDAFTGLNETFHRHGVKRALRFVFGCLVGVSDSQAACCGARDN